MKSARVELQQLLGTDKRNPCLSVYREAQAGWLHVYYGAELLEQVKGDRRSCEYKLLLGRLYNAGVKVSALEEAFGVGGKTLRRYGRAMEKGDAEELVWVLAGRGAKRKLTVEIRSYVRMRFRRVYEQERYRYNQRLRAEVLEVFGVRVSGEAVRGICQELKGRARGKAEEGANACECAAEVADRKAEQIELLPPGNGLDAIEDGEANRKQLPVFCGLKSPAAGCAVVRFHHHVGVLLFSEILQAVETRRNKDGWVLKQWLAVILLGAVNIEQTKLLDFDDLQELLGRTLRLCHPQRRQLTAVAQTDAAAEILRWNGQLVGVNLEEDFYYDPHSKSYSGQLKILRGWCGSKHFADKVLYLDMIHTSIGAPVYVEYADNYQDLRERFCPTVERFRQGLEVGAEKTLTMVVDRGIYGMEMFATVLEHPRLHLITWEKNYQQGDWDEVAVAGEFILERPRNRAHDLRIYRFVYLDQNWQRNGRMRQLRVRATNPEGRTIELGILSDDRQRPAPEIIRLMFRRWLQENDFKYLEKHFGINQLTSYAAVPYRQIREQVEDKQMKSGVYKALEKERQDLCRQLKSLLFQEHQHPGKDARRAERIQTMDRQHQEIRVKLAQTAKDISKLDVLIEQDYHRLNTANKRVLDALKLLARNAFYQALQPFKKMYDNFRDDHALFRNLTRADGLLLQQPNGCLNVQLFPTAHYPPALRRIVEKLLDQINANNPRMPDRSGRPIRFNLGKKEGIQIAIV
jgi:hypothetical protein